MTIQEGINQVERAYKKIQEANNLVNDAIMNAFLFTWQWWLGVALYIMPWVVWVIFRKKESTARLLLSGFTAIITGLIIDIFAMSMGKWSYPITFVPNTNVMFLPYHFSMLPVGVMFALQIKPNMNPFIKGTIFGVFSAYLIEPFFAINGFYNSKGWPYLYDVFIYLFIYLVSYWFSTIDHFEKLRSEKG